MLPPITLAGASVNGNPKLAESDPVTIIYTSGTSGEAKGVILTAGTPVYDVVRNAVYRREGGRPLEIPAGAVVVPGSRALNRGKAVEWGLSVYAPVIIKYRDEKTDASAALEDAPQLVAVATLAVDGGYTAM